MNIESMRLCTFHDQRKILMLIFCLFFRVAIILYIPIWESSIILNHHSQSEILSLNILINCFVQYNIIGPILL